MSAYVFLCTEQTEKECYERQLFGTNNVKYFEKYFKEIEIGDDIFLYNLDSRTLKGPFKALTKCSKKIIQQAWRDKFPYQVRVQSYAYEKGLLSDKVKRIINFDKTPPPQVSDEIKEKLILSLKNINGEVDNKIDDTKISNYWIFKCDKTTSGRVFADNIVGAPTASFPNLVNNVQSGDMIFVWQIEERRLYGVWKAVERGKYDEYPFQESGGKYNAVVQCERYYNLLKGIGEDILTDLHVPFGENKMPVSVINIETGKCIQEKLLKINSNSSVVVPGNTIAGKYLTDDGHWVRSQGEVIIDNWLYWNNLVHAYEYRIQIGNEFKKPDFYLPQYKLIIEYWGMVGDKEYDAQRKNKVSFYKTNKINFLELFPQDIAMLSEILKSKLSNYGIYIL